jgi:signal transduction histidine kinase
VTARTASSTLSRTLVLAVLALLAGTLFGSVGELEQVGYGDRPPVWVLGDFIGGWTFLLTGAVAWARRPDNRIGPLLLTIGFSWFVGTHVRASVDWMSYLARAFQGYYEPLIGALVLAYPSGRLAGRPERFVIGVWLLNQVAWSIAQLVLLRPLSWYSCPTCLETADAYIANRYLLEAIGPVTLALSVGLGGAVLVLAARRLLAAGPAGRRRLAPVALASLALALGILAPNGIRLTIDAALYVDARVVALSYVLDMLAAVAVLGGLLQDRLARTAVADLVIDLRRDAAAIGTEPRRLRDALARALGDPSLELFLFDPGTDGYRDATGRPAALPTAGPSRAVTLIGGDGDRVAAIAHDPVLLDDPGLISAVTTAVRLESDNRQLTGEVERQLAELRASRTRIVTATDAERRRVERDLHDGAQQRLVSLSMELGRVRAAAARSADPELVGSLAALSAELEAAIEELRELARGILPPILTDAGLGPAVESLALRAPLPVDAEVSVPGRLPPAIESTLYFVIAEGLANVARHAHATRVTIRIAGGEGRVSVEVADDGVGGAAVTRGSGIQGLIDRVGALGGTLRVDSRDGGGTTLRAEVPIPP